MADVTPLEKLKAAVAGQDEVLQLITNCPEGVAHIAAVFFAAAEEKGWVPTVPAPWITHLLTVELGSER